MKPKKSKGRFIFPMPENVDQVAKDAYDRGELGAGVYEKLVRAGLHDMREPGVSEWKDTTAVYAEVTPPPPPVHDHVKDYVEDYIERLSARLKRPFPKSRWLKEYPVDGVTEGVEVQGDRSEEKVAKEEQEAAGMEEEEEDREGQGFLWCFGCGRVDVVRYGSKALSDYFKGASTEVESGIVFVLCDSCRGTPTCSWQAKAAKETSIGSSFQTLKLMPQMFEGSEVVQAVRAVAKRRVSIITNNGGVAYRDVDRIVKELGTKDRLASISLDTFRAG
ncbi:hypothetical protein B0A54_17129 [Friedmanniomyces endolithicus]|uniref:Uncharacterized protein n=1 Tax=Friedmanniomyces endolithicus TaxID=329885 RepID=A0A4U0U0G7_9PEZI|nr:hypothetical protein B0A54_17129 [Friedmanniomyces endolithicus]